LADEYIREETIADVTCWIAEALFDATQPVEHWGLRPYSDFRSKSEQQRRWILTGNGWRITMTCWRRL
jgi:hypothetical protein